MAWFIQSSTDKDMDSRLLQDWSPPNLIREHSDILEHFIRWVVLLVPHRWYDVMVRRVYCQTSTCWLKLGDRADIKSGTWSLFILCFKCIIRYKTTWSKIVLYNINWAICVLTRILRENFKFSFHPTDAHISLLVERNIIPFYFTGTFSWPTANKEPCARTTILI